VSRFWATWLSRSFGPKIWDFGEILPITGIDSTSSGFTKLRDNTAYAEFGITAIITKFCKSRIIFSPRLLGKNVIIDYIQNASLLDARLNFMNWPLFSLNPTFKRSG